jgi:hypothetical protein
MATPADSADAADEYACLVEPGTLRELKLRGDE